MHWLRVWGLFWLVLGLGACDNTKPSKVEGERVADASAPEVRVETHREKSVTHEEPTKTACVSVRDCPNQDCIQGKCVPTDSCSGHRDCKSNQRCFEDRCATRCERDNDCPKGHVCADGMCHKPNWVQGKLPNAGSTTRKPLKVGLGVAQLDFPLGVSMAGFGFRPGPRGPYARSLGASEGQYDRFNVKVLMLDDGVERIVLIRSPLVFTTDFLLTQIAQRVIKATGIDLTDKIIMTSTHSHSAPARFWNLLPQLNFGAFGGGDFLPEVFRRLADSFTAAVLQAQKNLAPGKIGYVIDPNFDPKNEIFSDRRRENPDYKEPRLLVLKAEKADGTPLAVIVSFPMHGTISEKTMLTNDAAGGLEFKTQERLEALEKKRVEVFFMQGPAGDVSPRGDKLGHHSTQQMQMLGALAAKHIETLYKTIQTQSDITLELVSKRIPITYQDIGYKNGEFFSYAGGDKVVYRYGAFQCVKDGTPADKPIKYKDGALGCVFSVEVLNGAPVPQFSKTHFTAARIGDLILTTFPGESTSHIARRLREAVVQRSGGKLKDIMVLGYSQDHQLYITGEQDWWHGGYEASMSIWGPKHGEYFLKNAIEVTLQLATKEKEKNDTGILPQDFYKLDLTPTVPRKQTPDAGKIAIQPPKTYMRMDGPMTFTVSGGFHGIDNPHVVLQRKEGAAFEDVKGPGGRLYDEFDYRIIMTFKVEKSGRNLYTYSFMELEDFPTGVYRFRIEGHKWDGSKRVPYTVETDPFEIVPSTKLRIRDVCYDGKALLGRVAYPAGTNDDGTNTFSALKQVGHRLRSTLVPWQVGPPLADGAKVELKIVIKQGGKTIDTLTADQLNVREVADVTVITSRDKSGKETTKKMKALMSGFKLPTQKPLAKGTYEITITIKDPHGNTGTFGPSPLIVK